MNDSYINNPEIHSWRYVLTKVQFTQEELLRVKDWVVIAEMIEYQKSLTKQFLREHFSEEIKGSLEVDWKFVELYVHK